MADFSVTPVATGIKPQPTMSLADMLNMARGFQAYQQAQQINPLRYRPPQKRRGYMLITQQPS